MIAYKLQDRVFKLLNDRGGLSFPNDLVLEVEYGPPEAFGMSNNPSRLVLRGSKTIIMYNSNTGRVKTQSTPSLSPLYARMEADNVVIELKGMSFQLHTKCESQVELHNILRTYLHAFPALLNLEFPDPPIMLSLTGKLGDVEFRWEHQKSIFHFKPRTKEDIEKHILDSINNIKFLDARLLAAVQYFHTSSRLIVVGYSSWEFMGEAILNFCKVLQILFSEKKDDVRSGLSKLGYSNNEIEMDFIPLMELRNHFDVGHAQSVIPQTEQLHVLYDYLSGAEDNIRNLLKRVFRWVADGRFKLHQEDYLGLKPNDKKEFDKLINRIRSRTITSNKPTS